MAKVIGTVENIPTRVLGSGLTMYNVQVNGKKYGCGPEQPPCKIGETIEFDEYKNNKGFDSVSKGSIKVVEAPPAAAPGATPARGGTDWASKDPRISYQAAYNSALNTVNFAFQVGALSLPTKTPAAEKFDLFKSMVFAVTDELFVKYMAINAGTAGKLELELLEDEAGDPNDWPAEVA